ncbi:hypothetical protein OPQ81_003678 [Rhizoctonia solani]|nr:hypothetical protein OPQ81_003678 [Rhizoctonia solani]
MGKGLSATQVGARLCYLVIDTAILYRLAHQYQLLLVPPAIPMLRSTSLLMCCLLGSEWLTWMIRILTLMICNPCCSKEYRKRKQGRKGTL